MLTTLLKHEWKDTWLVGTICNAITVVMSVVGCMILLTQGFDERRYQSNTTGALMIGGMIFYFALYVITIFSMVMIVRFFFFHRYYKNLFTDQGYLMHTLPATSTELINAKLIVAVVWQYITGIVCIVSAFAIGFAIFYKVSDGDFSMWDLKVGFIEVYRQILEVAHIVPIVIFFLLQCIVGPILEILMTYVAVGIGQLTKKNKFLVSILVLIGIYIVRRYLTSVVTIPIRATMIRQNEIAWTIDMSMLIAGLAICGVTIGLYFLNKYFVEHHLNLE